MILIIGNKNLAYGLHTNKPPLLAHCNKATSALRALTLEPFITLGVKLLPGCKFISQTFALAPHTNNAT